MEENDKKNNINNVETDIHNKQQIETKENNNTDDVGINDNTNSKKTINKKAIVAMIIIVCLLVFGLIYIIDALQMKNTPIDMKPIIYLYPTEETNVTVMVGKPENLTHTYPKYENSWEVTAKPNGDLVDLKTGRSLYALYWEGINTVKTNMKEGFIVKGEEVVEFLEEKLEILGLNEREQEEFIVYWLPKLEENKYNFIRFQTTDEINENMPLEINPKPDSLIRILMEFKGLEEPIKVKQQILETPERIGFTVVEWGGTEIK